MLWCDWGKAFEIGAETCAPYINSIVFRNCDIIHGSIIIQQGDGGDIDNVLFEDIRMEYCGEEMCPAIQEEEDQQYPLFGTPYTPVPFMLTAGVSIWSIDDYCGNMKNIRFKDISITAYDGVSLVGGKIKPDETSGSISGVYFENITLNGKKCGFEEFDLEISQTVKDVIFDGIVIK